MISTAGRRRLIELALRREHDAGCNCHPEPTLTPLGDMGVYVDFAHDDWCDLWRRFVASNAEDDLSVYLFNRRHVEGNGNE